MVGKQAKRTLRPKRPLQVQTPGVLQEERLERDPQKRKIRKKDPAIVSASQPASQPACESDSSVMHSGRDSAH